MAEWQLVNLTVEGYSISKAGWQGVADIIGGSAYTAEELGYTSISGIHSRLSDLSIVGVYVPSGANYGIISYQGWSGGGPDTWSYAVKLGESETTAYQIGNAPYYNYGAIRVYAGDGFSILANISSESSPRWMVFETFHDVANDRDFLGCLTGSSVFDMEYEHSSLSGSVYSMPIYGQSITQTDGSLYAELILIFGYRARIDDTSVYETVYSTNLYKRFLDYATTERTILLNGIKFQSILTSEIFFPTE